MKKDWIARELTIEVVVGAFMLMVLLGLGYFTILLSHETLFRERYVVDVVFDRVMGLRDGDSVGVRGMMIGKVRELELMEDGVHVTAALDEKIEIREGYKISINQSSVLGGRFMEIDAGPEGAPVVPPDTTLQGVPPYDLMKGASELVSGLREGLLSEGTIENIRVTTEKVRRIAERIESGKGTVGRLMSEDDTLYEDLAQTASSLREITARLEQGTGALGKLMSDDDTLYADLAAAAHSMKTIAERVENGEGTIGKLLADDDMYEELEGVVTEIRATMDDFRETSPVVTFTSIFFGAF